MGLGVICVFVRENTSNVEELKWKEMWRTVAGE